MSDAEALAHEIEALTAIQRNAWRELAGPTLTTFDRREIRNRIRQAEVDLRHFLGIRAERLRSRRRPVEPVTDSLARLEFRFFRPRLALDFEDVGASARHFA
ncbi:MAG: hypothetical protein WA820_16980 [Bradyrhizobium sp.]|jgi:hypothetical protein